MVGCNISIRTIYFLTPKVPPHGLFGQNCKSDKQDHLRDLENPVKNGNKRPFVKKY